MTSKTLAIILAIILTAVLAVGGTLLATRSSAPAPAAKAPVAATAPAKAKAAAPAPTKTVTAPAPKVIVVTPTPVYVQPAAPAFTSSIAVVDQFYQDISDGDYLAAWNLGGYNLDGAPQYDSMPQYNAWVAGYATTVSITLSDTSEFGSGEVTASLSAVQTDGSVNTYYGTYYVSGGIITGANIVQTA